jgi:hypothetical protein
MGALRAMHLRCPQGLPQHPPGHLGSIQLYPGLHKHPKRASLGFNGVEGCEPAAGRSGVSARGVGKV